MTTNQRIDNLERTVKRWRWLTGLLAVSLGTAMIVGQARPTAQIITAKEFSVLDDNGNVRASLTVDDNAARLTLYEPSGSGRAELAVMANGSPRLTLADHTGSGRAEVTVSPDNTPHITLTDQSRKAVFSVSAP